MATHHERALERIGARYEQDADLLALLVIRFRDWPAAPEGPWSRFGRDRETNWLEGAAALADS